MDSIIRLFSRICTSYRISTDFFDYLKDFHFTGEVWAVAVLPEVLEGEMDLRHCSMVTKIAEKV
jgi:hypothetical protein